MKERLSLLLVAAGLFGSMPSATKYVSSLDQDEAVSLFRVLNKNEIKKSPKVALATGEHGGMGKNKRNTLNDETIKKNS